MNWTVPSSNYSPKKPLFLCVLSTTDIAKVPGISGAGKTPEYTPAGDAEIVMLGRTHSIDEPPMTNSTPTPAVITRASMELTGVPCLFVDAGLRVRPEVPLLNIGASPSADIRTGRAVDSPVTIVEQSFLLGRQLSKTFDFVVIGESVPGGTTTALGTLRAIGYDARVSSSFSKNPVEIKDQVVNEAMSKNNIFFGDLKDDPLKAVELFGDSMMPAVAGLVKGLSGVDTVLAGGTQMMAVLAIIKHLDIEGDISIATTKFIAEDKTANFLDTVSTLGYKAYISDPGFSKARFEGLRMYEAGDVKDGVGAGGAMFLANLLGIGQSEFRDKVDEICTAIMK
ncbi:MAG: hypothetical protein DNFNHJIP_00474 [Candidatus Argoarchaeum ethanivorans]|uniref:UPF0284 protein DNFNHJIP_00474 n=1 Tax=Candidatus Argoarchaeum ethanivorans TaxID=2608793 RepID=A0A812A0K5_9EURY|nr:MAG: hypothetical protein DNFNHJIP_00474 [Candidatus Argoarchaeum ethanivorans]